MPLYFMVKPNKWAQVDFFWVLHEEYGNVPSFPPAIVIHTAKVLPPFVDLTA